MNTSSQRPNYGIYYQNNGILNNIKYSPYNQCDVSQFPSVNYPANQFIYPQQNYLQKPPTLNYVPPFYNNLNSPNNHVNTDINFTQKPLPPKETRSKNLLDVYHPVSKELIDLSKVSQSEHPLSSVGNKRPNKSLLDFSDLTNKHEQSENSNVGIRESEHISLITENPRQNKSLLDFSDLTNKHEQNENSNVGIRESEHISLIIENQRQNKSLVDFSDKIENHIADHIIEAQINEPENSTEELESESDTESSCNEQCVDSPSPSCSIPIQIDNLSNGTDEAISHTSSASEIDLNHNLDSLNNNRRKVYDRASFLQIGKSENSLDILNPLENLESKEIVIFKVSKIEKILALKSFGLNKQKVINIGGHSKLSKLSNGYLPPHLRLKEECSKNTYLESYRRNLKNLLNKVAPQNFDHCASEIKSIIKSIDSEQVSVDQRISCFIEEIFEKAVKQETYIETYTKLCHLFVKFDHENNFRWNLKKSLVDRCKKMFQTPLQDQMRFIKEYWEKKVEDEPDPKLKDIYRSDIEEQIKKERDKYFGNIRFIGELYVEGLINSKSIDSCISSLLIKSSDEDALLSLCKLMETCGKKFDNEDHDLMTKHIKTMSELITSEKLETKIKCKILDIIEMSERNWTLRNIQKEKIVRPKTLDEVKNDDIIEKSLNASKFSSKQKNRSLNFKGYDCPSMRNRSIDINSLSLSNNQKFDLKPTNYNQWNAGSKENDLIDGKFTDSRKNGKVNNHYSFDKQKRFNPMKSVENSFSGKMFSKNKFSALASEDEMYSSLPSSNSSISNQSYQEIKSEEFVRTNSVDLFDDLLDSKIINMIAWDGQSSHSNLICLWLDRLMEKQKPARNLVGDELANLFANSKLSAENLIDGLNQFIELIEDLIADVPKIWSFFAEFLERFFQNTDSCLDFLNTVFQHRLPSKEICECVKLTLKYATERLGNDIVKSVVDVHLQCLLKSMLNQKEILAEFQAENLTFLIPGNKECAINKFSDQLKSELIHQLSGVNDTLTFLESKFEPGEMQTDQFVFFLGECLFSAICKLSNEKDVFNFIVDKEEMLKSIINLKPSLEHQLLMALVNFTNHLHEKNFLLTTLQNMNSRTIISINAIDFFIDNFTRNLPVLCDKNYQILMGTFRSILNNDRR